MGLLTKALGDPVEPPKACLLAAQNFHEECSFFPDCSHNESSPQEVATVPELREIDPNKTRRGKDDSQVLDPKSTGRKRAAKLFPLDRAAPCEWQGKKFILDDGQTFIGCVKGLQHNIHHGPDKDTLKNEVGNVWRICAHCHNLYHALVDPTYRGDGSDFRPIILESATLEELAERQMRPVAKAGKRSVMPHD